MTEKIYPVPANVAENAHVNAADYQRLYAESVAEPDAFWGNKAQLLDWDKPFDTVKNTSFVGEVAIKWFEGGQLNVAANCLDRHLANNADKDAFIFIPDDANAPPQHISYAELHARVCRCANMLKKLGVKAKDRVTIYMPMVPEAAIAMLACARIGAIHSVVFGGFSPSSLRNRIQDCESRVVITANEGVRGGKKIPLKANVDKACEGADVAHVLVMQRTETATEMKAGRDVWWHELEAETNADCPPEAFGAEHPLFILYTSGSTGKPKGLLHTSAGYLLYAALTFQTVFDYKPDEVFWCTADVGWITGHSYMIYGPLAVGATSVLFEGVPNYPDAGRFWREVERLKVNSFYTAPTAIRMLMGSDDAHVTQYDRSSLRILGSVGEPINPEAWRWYHEVVGEERCQIVDTWWQTETGGHLITPLPGATNLKPGCATQPFFGVQPALLSAEQRIIEGAGEGALCMADSWPGQARTIWNDHKRFIDTYFAPYPGYYFSGDGAKRDEDGDYWILGRMDDVLNVSGHRLGTAEIESALVAHEAVTEAAVVGFPHAVKGEGIYAFVTLKPSFAQAADDTLKTALRQWVRAEIGAIAAPEIIQFAPALPKTRSGKIMRRILRKIAAGDVKSEADYAVLGDISTLLNPEAVDDLVAGAA